MNLKTDIRVLVVTRRRGKTTTFNQSVWATICLVMFVYSKPGFSLPKTFKLYIRFMLAHPSAKLSKHGSWLYNSTGKLFQSKIWQFYPIVSSSMTWKESEWNPMGRCSVYSSPQNGLRFFHTVAVLRGEVQHAYSPDLMQKHHMNATTETSRVESEIIVYVVASV